MGLLDQSSGSTASPLPPGSGFAPADSEAAFTGFLAGVGASLEQLDAESATRHVLAWYGGVRAHGCPPQFDGDMLLFQWGVYDWGSGPSFQFDLTRQFIKIGPDPQGDDDEMSQLSLTLHFAPTDALRELGIGNQWCPNPEAVAEFEQFVTASAAYRAVTAAPPNLVELRWSMV